MTPASSSNICRRAVCKEELSSKTVLKDSLTYNHQQHHHHPKHHHPHHHQTPLTPNGSYTKHHLHQTSFFTKHLFDTTHFPSLSGKFFFPSVFLFRIKPSGLKLPVPGKPGTPGVPGDRATGRRGVAGTMPLTNPLASKPMLKGKNQEIITGMSSQNMDGNLWWT